MELPKRALFVLAFIVIMIWGYIYQTSPQTSPERGLEGKYSDIKIGYDWDNKWAISQNSFIVSMSPLVVPERRILATIFAYNAVKWQTDEDYCISASGLDICKYPDRVIACPAWLAFNTKIRIGDEVYFCQDRMSAKRRYSENPAYFDILKPTVQESREWGRRELIIEIY